MRIASHPILLRRVPPRFSGGLLVLLSVLGLTACDGLFPPTATPGYTIKVMATPDGVVAEPPTCLGWTDYQANPFEGQPLPQFGCANARNLAIMVEQPNDLIEGRDSGPGVATTSATAMERYNTNQTTPLINPAASSPTTQTH